MRLLLPINRRNTPTGQYWSSNRDQSFPWLDIHRLGLGARCGMCQQGLYRSATGQSLLPGLASPAGRAAGRVAPGSGRLGAAVLGRTCMVELEPVRLFDGDCGLTPRSRLIDQTVQPRLDEPGPPLTPVSYTHL